MLGGGSSNNKQEVIEEPLQQFVKQPPCKKTSKSKVEDLHEKMKGKQSKGSSRSMKILRKIKWQQKKLKEKESAARELEKKAKEGREASDRKIAEEKEAAQKKDAEKRISEQKNAEEKETAERKAEIERDSIFYEMAIDQHETELKKGEKAAGEGLRWLAELATEECYKKDNQPKVRRLKRVADKKIAKQRTKEECRLEDKLLERLGRECLSSWGRGKEKKKAELVGDVHDVEQGKRQSVGKRKREEGKRKQDVKKSKGFASYKASAEMPAPKKQKIASFKAPAEYEPPEKKQAAKRASKLPAEKATTKRQAREKQKEEEELEKVKRRRKTTEKEIAPFEDADEPAVKANKGKNKMVVYEDEADDSDEGGGEKAQTRGGHVKLMTWISKLSDEKIKAVRDIGFGPILDFQLPQFDSTFCSWLVDSFEENSQMFHLSSGERIEILEEDVHIVYGLPNRGQEIEEAKSERTSEEYGNFIRRWKSCWMHENKKTKKIKYNVIPSVRQIVDFYTNPDNIDGPADDWFITNFVVVAVNCLMKCTKNSQCHFKFLYSIMDRNRIRELNWCKYVFDSLLKSNVEWRESKDKSFYKGPLPFLTLYYFDRVQRLNKKPPRTIPIISAWTRDDAVERMQMEKNGGFGKGKVLQRIQMQSEINPKEFMDDFVLLANRAMEKLAALNTMLKKAQKIFPNNQLVKKVYEFLSKMAKEPSISNQDKESFGSDDFLNALDEKDWELMQALNREKQKKERQGIEYDPITAFDVGILTPTTPSAPDVSLSTPTPSVAANESSAKQAPAPPQEIDSFAAITTPPPPPSPPSSVPVEETLAAAQLGTIAQPATTAQPITPAAASATPASTAPASATPASTTIETTSSKPAAATTKVTLAEVETGEALADLQGVDPNLGLGKSGVMDDEIARLIAIHGEDVNIDAIFNLDAA